MPWKCEYCTFQNLGESAEACEWCGVKKPQPPPRRAARPRPPAPGVEDRQRRQEQKQQQQLEQQQQQQQQQQQLEQQQQQQQQIGQAPASAPEGLFQGDRAHDERTQLLEEILESERAYVDSLRILVTHFLQPIELEIREGSSVITEKKLHNIFSNVSQLLQLNVELLRVMELELDSAEQLRKRANSISDANAGGEDIALAITKAFNEIIPYFKMYSWYVNNYPSAVELLKHEQTTNKRFAKYLADKHAHEICRGLDVGAYLIMPVQRLCKYPLLFGRLLKETPPENSDYEYIKQVTEVVNAITEVVDLDRDRAERSLRGFEIANFLSLEAISRRLDTKLHVLQPGRHFLFEWTCMISRSLSKRRSAGGPQKQRTMFLFSDSLIIAKKGSKGYDARVWMSLSNVLLGDLSPSASGSASKLVPVGSSTVADPPSPPSASRSSFTWTPKLMGSAKRSGHSSPTASGTPSSSSAAATAQTAAPAPGNDAAPGDGSVRMYTFSIINESSMALARMPLARSRARKSGVETFTFFFTSEDERRKVHTELENAIVGLQETALSRPRPLSSNSVLSLGMTGNPANSLSFNRGRRPLSEGNFAPVARKARSLSPPPARDSSAPSVDPPDPYQSAFTTDEDDDGVDGDHEEEEDDESVEGVVPFSLTSRTKYKATKTATGAAVSQRKAARPPAPMRPPAPTKAQTPPPSSEAGTSSKARPKAPTRGSQSQQKARPKAPTKASGDSRAISSSDWTSAPIDDVRPETPLRLTSRSSSTASSASNASSAAVSIFSSKPVTVLQRPAPLALAQDRGPADSGASDDSQVQLVDKWFGNGEGNDSPSRASVKSMPAPRS